MVSATAALSISSPKPKVTLLFAMKNHITRDFAVSSDGRRVYYSEDTTQLYMFDRVTHRSTPVLGPMVGAGASVAISRAGDHLAFTRNAEDGGKPQLWIVSLDPKSGLPNGAPKRVSILTARSPAFSPDGRSIAFATPTSPTAKNLMVVPANGGPERIVTETQGDVWPIAWQSTDTITFGGAFDEKDRQSKNGVYRVSAAGGTPQFVVRTADWGASPGLSPDGRFVLAFDSTWDSVMVATPTGKRLASYAVRPGEATADVWSGNQAGIGWRDRVIRAAHVVGLAGEKDRIVEDATELQNPVWSPDGRRMSVFRSSPPAVVVADISAGTRRVIPVEQAPRSVYVAQWSPDERYIAYLRRGGAIGLIDLSTSRSRVLAPQATTFPLAHWRSDSRALLYTVVDPPAKANVSSKIDIHEVTVDGQDRVLHSIEMQCGSGGACGKIVDDSLIATWADGDYRITNFRTRTAPRSVYKRDGTFQPVATFSANGLWMAIRRQSPTDQRWSIEVMHPDGSAHRSVPLSFAPVRGARNPWIRDDGGELIVGSADCTETLAHACPNAVSTLYRVDVATGKATAVAAVTNASRQLEDAMVSNDGRSLIYLRDVEKRVEFYEFDFSELLKSARQP